MPYKLLFCYKSLKMKVNLCFFYFITGNTVRGGNQTHVDCYSYTDPICVDISVEYAEMDVWFIPFPRIINYSVCK